MIGYTTKTKNTALNIFLFDAKGTDLDETDLIREPKLVILYFFYENIQ